MGFRLRNLKSGICSQSKVYLQHPSNNIILFHCIRGLHTAANHFHNSFVTIQAFLFEVAFADTTRVMLPVFLISNFWPKEI